MNNIQNKKKEFIRLNHYLSNSGISSRREADKLIQSGIVKVNGIPVTKLGTIIHVNDVIKLHGNRIKNKKKIYILLNKPKGFITSTHDPFNRKTVMSLIPNFSDCRIFPIGRLDRSTTGVLLLTNDGFITEKLTHPKYNVKKIYHVLLNKKIHDEDIYRIKKGKIFLKEGRVKVDFIYREKRKNRIKIGLHIGWNRVIKRIFKKLTYQVIQLDRINFGGFTKKDIKIGCWCFLNKKEINNTLKNFFDEKN
ncbi:rRNA pseudouridine synthase [Blattabacterium sp. (Cryptocercus kyebangensis)]|uniref:pseudouridine synthase n=1 Tax=Blattabacterium sp. (Cryptocercus kyebangensis) TaxID=298656 RepID=UPI000D7CFC07|nr:pseudouridine synthase [Blattabacterium sp. (Cryptocercus kyebangensis)]AWU43549.1 rRNA pseudouridine synthase [Blattabacterium sp. (Cryptocercus kyebangensis)]